MNMKKIAMGAAALALVACSNQSAPKKVSINANTTDDQKFAYMLGAQFGGQNLVIIPRQMGEELDLDALVQGARDNVKANNDTTFKLQLTTEQLQAVGEHYTAIARQRVAETRPDSATLATMSSDYAKLNAYADSVARTQPIVPAAPATGNAVVLNEKSSDNQKFSYLIGMQFGNQLAAISRQYESPLDDDYFALGIRESAAKLKDSTFAMQLPQDSLVNVGKRFQAIMQEKQQAAVKKQQEEMEKLKAEVAAMKGDTLANGMPKLMNYKVKVSGFTVKAEDLTAYANKPLLMFYFSATCGHCAHAAPQILEIAKQYQKDGLTTIAVASGGNNKTSIRKFLDNAQFDETISVVWDDSHQFGELYSDGYVPKVYVVNPDGTYKQYAAFENDKETIKSDIDALLKGTPVVWNPEPPKAEEPAADSAAQAPAAPAAKK